MNDQLATILIALLAGTFSAIAALLIMRRFPAPLRGGATRLMLERVVEPMVFLFRHRTLIDITPPARALLATQPGDGDWARVMSYLAMRFPDAPDLVTIASELGQAGATTIGDAGNTLRAEIEDLGQGLLRITLSDPKSENAGIVVDSQSFAAMENELDTLRDTIDNSPVMIWREDADGTIRWANSTYLREALTDDETIWPIPRLLDLPVEENATALRRARMDTRFGTRWLDCHIRQRGDQRTICALPADATVRAESSLREFVQTLTKTFADLPIGLAIFDRQRNLQLFNPALIDLTGVATGFLTARPSLYAFLDRLREARMVPEPKDYRSWRHMMTTLEAAASQGHHVETWTLPGGQTYRVTGRPHPDGAIALLFEDITSEITLTQRFRAELSLSRELLDVIDSAVAVFNSNARLISANAAYLDLFGYDIGGHLTDHQARWFEVIGPNQRLGALAETLAARPRASNSGGQLTPADGGIRDWSLRALNHGRYAMIFSPNGEVSTRQSGTPDPVAQAAEMAEPPEAAPGLGQNPDLSDGSAPTLADAS